MAHSPQCCRSAGRKGDSGVKQIKTAQDFPLRRFVHGGVDPPRPTTRHDGGEQDTSLRSYLTLTVRALHPPSSAGHGLLDKHRARRCGDFNL